VRRQRQHGDEQAAVERPGRRLAGGVRGSAVAAAHLAVHRLVDGERREQPDAEYQVAEVVGVGQPAGRLEPAHRLPDVRLQVDERGEQQHARAEAQHQRRDRRLPRNAGRVLRGQGPAVGQFQRQHSAEEREQEHDERGGRLGRGYPVRVTAATRSHEGVHHVGEKNTATRAITKCLIIYVVIFRFPFTYTSK